MPARNPFEYATIRVVPRIEREEFLNAGVILLCRGRRFLGARVGLDSGRLAALWPDLDSDALAAQLAHIPSVCSGGTPAGPIGELPLYERFRWLIAPRSTIIQPSPVHCGLCADPQDTLDNLFARLVATNT